MYKRKSKKVDCSTPMLSPKVRYVEDKIGENIIEDGKVIRRLYNTPSSFVRDKKNRAYLYNVNRRRK